MSWAGKAAEAAWQVLGYGRGFSEGERRSGFNTGARWQRDQLRTDEAIERVANALCVEEEGMTLAEHEANCELPICGFRQSFLADARRSITALLGEEP
ncbi:hypothetical protein [Brevibacterium sediminis]|uniref:hypothetical protein n=1 Tax=Brevibacterium sediminis TaxID=1857024 RepID=UPI0036729EF1